MKALSIVFPGGTKIACGEKKLEIRSWSPPSGFNEDLLIVENHRFLRQEGETDPEGQAVAIVKIKNVRTYLESDIQDACASRWDPGYFAWELSDVRPLLPGKIVIAARGIYEVDY